MSTKTAQGQYGQIDASVIADTFLGETFGMELAGEVVAVGPGVEEFKLGDSIITPVPGSFRSYATVKTTYCMPKPECLSYAQAPVMIGYLTAYRGLVDVADIQAGEKVLIHNATGGVGFAAIQIANWKGAEIHATAGTEEKREHLKEMGIKHIYHSRDLRFAEEIRAATDGYGVDVVISAQSGEAIYQSFDLLAAYGRYIEIGKKDISQNAGLPMRPFNRNISFVGVDIDRMLASRTSIIQRLLRDIGKGFAEGYFKPMPIASFPAEEAIEAFRFMAQSKHVGKVVLELGNHQVETLPTLDNTLQLDSQASYLVTGGTGGFGLEVAKWMAKRGAGQLVLISRRGVVNEEAHAAVREMEAGGTQIMGLACDVTDPKSVSDLVSNVQKGDFPLRGVIHSAMVLDDCFLPDLNRDRLLKVLGPKVDGAMALHQALENIPLNFFVSFSSISALIGNPGQGNYVLANGFLDGFARYRRSKGQCGTTINWGVLSESGVLARNSEVEELLKLSGITGFSNAMALQSLGTVLQDLPPQIGIFNVDWERWSMANPTAAKSSRFHNLIEAGPGAQSPADARRAELAEELAAMDEGARRGFVEDIIVGELARILKFPKSRVDVSASLSSLGVDSLMAVELTQAFQRALGLELTTVDLLNGPSTTDLAKSVLESVVTREDELLAHIDELSEAELDALLEAELDELGDD